MINPSHAAKLLLLLLCLLPACDNNDDGHAANNADPNNAGPNNADPNNADPNNADPNNTGNPDDCQQDAQCAADETCVEGRCEAVTPECTQDSDCGARQICQDNQCIEPEPLCPPNATTCDDNMIVTCDEGTGQEDRQDCGDEATCVEDNQGARCAPILCDRDVCQDDNTVLDCGFGGLEQFAYDCTEDERCRDGECVFVPPASCDDALGDLSTPALAASIDALYEELSVCPGEPDHFTGSATNVPSVLYLTLETQDDIFTPLQASLFSNTDMGPSLAWELKGLRTDHVDLAPNQDITLRLAAQDPLQYDLEGWICPDDALDNDSWIDAPLLRDHLSETLSHCAGNKATWYQIDLVQNQSMRLAFRPQEPQRDLDRINLLLHNEQGDEVAFSTRVLNNDDLQLEVPYVPATGTYTLSLRSSTGRAGGQYQFQLSTTPPADKPDLELLDVEVQTDQIDFGQPFNVAFDVKNAGLQPTGEYQATYYLSPDPFLDPTDQVVSDITYPSLTPGQSQTLTTDITLPDRDPNFSYYVCFALDAPEALDEQNEENNTWCTQFTPGEPIERQQLDCEDALEPNDNYTRAIERAPGTYQDLTLCREADRSDHHYLCPEPGTEVSVNLAIARSGDPITMFVSTANGDRITSRGIFNELSPVTFTAPSSCVWLAIQLDITSSTTYDMELLYTPR